MRAIGSKVRWQEPVDVLEEEVEGDHEWQQANQRSGPVAAKLAAHQVGPGCDGRERNTPDANSAIGRRIAKPAFVERIGDALVDSIGPEHFGIDDWHIDRKGQVGVEATSSLKITMRCWAVYFGWHDVRVSVALVGSDVATTQ